MGYRYAVIGAGRQGLAAAYDIGRFGEADEILLYDSNLQIAEKGAQRLNSLLDTPAVNGTSLDAKDKTQLQKALRGINATVSAVPYPLNPLISEVAIQSGSSLCDLGGHTETVRKQLKLGPAAQQAGVTLTPDCGMGPGLNISLAVYAMSFISEPEELFIWDGGLPENPSPPWNYQLTFNINGLTNEYFGEAQFLRNGKVTPVPCLTEIEIVDFPPPLGRLEAAVTSGGLSTAPWTFEGKLQRLENKTLRYPGHWNQFQSFQRLGLFEEKPINIKGSKIIPRDLFHALLEPQISSDQIRDICVIRTRCHGKVKGRKNSCTVELIETYDEKTGFTAMEKFTGWHASIVAILSARGEITRGAVPVEQALLGDTLTREASQRGWNIKTTTAH